MRGRKIVADARMGVGWELTRGRGEVRVPDARQGE